MKSSSGSIKRAKNFIILRSLQKCTELRWDKGDEFIMMMGFETELFR